jgi:hypothetical protein
VKEQRRQRRLASQSRSRQWSNHVKWTEVDPRGTVRASRTPPVSTRLARHGPGVFDPGEVVRQFERPTPWDGDLGRRQPCSYGKWQECV